MEYRKEKYNKKMSTLQKNNNTSYKNFSKIPQITNELSNFAFKISETKRNVKKITNCNITKLIFKKTTRHYVHSNGTFSRK